MTGETDVSLEFDLIDDSLVDLTVAELPEGHGQHHVGNVLHQVKGQHCHLLVERGRLTVVVAHKKALVDVQDDEGEAGNSVERGHGATIAEGDTDLEKDGGVTVMDKVLGASIQVDVGLN